ncbi:adenylylsulfate kinase [Mucilaginibacter mallensis]|uniref:Adenylyl-sulfate kinase n=1 Tax=Mucilaginibacter mallensis TaxID=652787 RepID=A0A1H2BRU7_MUCMA|nr:adenylyl-sulfate kinase [Mucilaginibacter mallensis]SDT60928.1 adenylylsulfate kinase [Mucilaginibacter mallensis]
MIILLCGLSGAGKTTLAYSVKNKLDELGKHTEILDGDEYRKMLFKELGYSQHDRMENIRRLGFIAGKLSKHGIITIISAINPYQEIRNELVNTYHDVRTVFVDCPIDILTRRDTKGLYARAQLPDNHPNKLHNLTGVNDRFDVVLKPDLHILTGIQTLTESTELLFSLITNQLIPA